MSKTKKALTSHLLAAAVPHLGPEADVTTPPKAVAKTLRKLAKQLLKKQKQGKTKKVAPAPVAKAKDTAKLARKVLAGELLATLQPYLGTAENTAESPAKTVTKTIKRLASALVKQRRKQAKRAAKAPRTVVVGSDAADLKKASRPVAPARPAARRAAAPKRPAAKPAVAPAAPAEGATE